MVKELIEKISRDKDLVNSHAVILNSFAPIAKEYDLTPENCPTNAAFIKLDYLIEMMKKGVDLYKLSVDELQIGFTAIEKASDRDTYYIEKVAVIPEYRHKGYGEKLVKFAIDVIRNKGGREISIALMNNNVKLKNWYRNLGFIETEVKSFPNLPFKACFMKMNL